MIGSLSLGRGCPIVPDSPGARGGRGGQGPLGTVMPGMLFRMMKGCGLLGTRSWLPLFVQGGQP